MFVFRKPFRENDGQAWVTCKFSGRPGCHGDLRSLGVSGEGIPYVTASEGFRIGSLTKKSIEIVHEDPNCKCTFFAPQASFRDIHLKSVVCLDVSSGGLGVSACTDNKLLVWETDRGILRRSLEGHIGDVYTCRFFPSGVVVLSAGADMQLKIWSAETGQCPVSLKGHTGAVLDTAIVEKGRNIISVSRDGSARLWDCGQATCLATLFTTNDAINSCALNILQVEPDLGHSLQLHSEREVGTEGKLLLVACENRSLRGVAVSTRQQVFEFPCLAAVNCCCYISPTLVACGSHDGQLNLLDLRNTSTPVQTWLHSAAAVYSLLPFKDGFLSSQNDGICMFHSTNAEDTWQLSGPDCDPVYRIASDGKNFFTCCRDGVIRKYKMSHI